MIVSFSSVFVNGLEQRRSAAFSGRSSGIFLLTGKSDRRKRSRNRDLDRPAISGIPKNRCRIGFLFAGWSGLRFSNCGIMGRRRLLRFWGSTEFGLFGRKRDGFCLRLRLSRRGNGLGEEFAWTGFRLGRLRFIGVSKKISRKGAELAKKLVRRGSRLESGWHRRCLEFLDLPIR